MKRLLLLLLLLLLLPLLAIGLRAADSSPLNPIRTENPRDTMKTFMEAMQDYHDGVVQRNPQLIDRIDDAAACLDLQSVPALVREDKGRTVAKLLKEVIDRVIVIDLAKVPNDRTEKKWRLKDTNITIVQIETGEHAGEYLFSEDTVLKAKSYYEKVKSLPYKLPNGGAFYSEPWADTHIPVWARGTTFSVANWQWLGLFLAILFGLVIRTITSGLLVILKKLATRSKTDWDDRIIAAVDRPVALLGAAGFWFFAVHLLRFDGKALEVLLVAVQLVFSVALIWLIFMLAEVLADYLQVLTAKTESTLDDHLVPLVRRGLRIFVILFGILMTVQNLGFNVLSLLAGLGLGGLAFALAARDMCANFFGSLMIFLDRPFNIGDWIITNGTEGTVEEIGFRSTRIRTFYNSQITVPNSLLANANIDNMGRREYRRIRAIFGITYDTPAEKVEAFIEGIKNIVKANPYTRKDYYHVVFTEYGDFNLQILLYCFLKVPDWATELVERQHIYLEVLRLAETLGVQFAFPTQTLHIGSAPGQPAPTPPAVAADELAAIARDYGPEGARAKPGGLGLFTPPYQEH